MLRLDELLGPLLAAFLFSIAVDSIRLPLRRREGYFLLFGIAAIASVSMAAAFVLKFLVIGPQENFGELSFLPLFQDINQALETQNADISIVASLMLLVVIIPYKILQRYIPYLSTHAIATRILRKSTTSQFELLLLNALEEQTSVLVSLKTRKVYVGRPVRLFDTRSDHDSIVIRLIASGYRDADTQQVKIKNFYDEFEPDSNQAMSDRYKTINKKLEEAVRKQMGALYRKGDDVESHSSSMVDLLVAQYYEEGLATPEEEASPSDLTIAIALSQIISISPFDFGRYDHFSDAIGNADTEDTETPSNSECDAVY